MRLVARTWLRDGEAFAQRLIGPVPTLQHGTTVPFSLELLEPDMILPRLRGHRPQHLPGIERNTWGRRGRPRVEAEPAGIHQLSASAQRASLGQHPARRPDRSHRTDARRERVRLDHHAPEDIKDYEERSAWRPRSPPQC